MSVRSLSPRQRLDQLKRQAGGLLRHRPELSRLFRDTAAPPSRMITGWRLGCVSEAIVEAIVGVTVSLDNRTRPSYDSEEGTSSGTRSPPRTMATFAKRCASAHATPRLGRAEYRYTPAIHFAVRERHAEAVQLLLTPERIRS